MGKKLAIKGHPTRGNEVIKFLEILGGKNTYGYTGDMKSLYFSIYNDTIIYGSDKSFLNDNYVFFTLEEFLEKYPFKIGDKVFDIADGDSGMIVVIKWDEAVSDMKYQIWFDNGDMGWYTNDTIALLKEDENLEETQSKQNIDKDVFRKEFCELCGSQRCSGQDDELEYCERFKNLIDNLGKTPVKNHKMGPKSKLPSKYYEEIQTKRDMDKEIFMIGPVMVPDKVDDKLEYDIIDGYEFDRVENGKIILKPIKPKYPTTYEDCCKVLGISYRAQLSYTYPDVERGNIYLTKEKHLLDAFMKLRICCHAYWKIAGEEMGLGKPWEPNWTTFEGMPAIFRFRYNIVCDSIKNQHCLLVFPTEEMRDTFYKNFKDLIEECKELL